MTAHVVPRAKPYPDVTATDAPAWEEDASTTIEPGDAADKLLPLAPRTNGTHTAHTQTGTSVEEHTVDEGSSPANIARLHITGGNDAGQSLEIRPNKSYTIGRGLDNDVVLTDIAVSRKHFDLKFEHGSWVIVDRGSGNGTVVNGTIEDSPFMLANGDTIEIGNTTFRFDLPNGPPRVSQRTYELDDEEMSTVAGKPLREDSLLTPRAPDRVDERPPPQLLVESPRPSRTKTAPPPIPQRSQPPNVPAPLTLGPPPGPPLNLAAAPHSVPPPAYNPQALPASTLPLPQMANRPMLAQPGSTTMVGDAMGMPIEVPVAIGPIGAIPSTIPGGQSAPPQRPSQFSYPQATDMPPHMLQIQSQSQRRLDGSTAHVAPAPYIAPVMASPVYAPQMRYPRRGLERRTKMLIAGVGLALVTGIVTAAIVKSSTKNTAPVARNDPPKAPLAAETKPAAKPQPTVTPIGKTTVEPIVTPAPPEPPKQEPPKQEPPKQDLAVTPKVEPAAPKVAPAPEPPKPATTPEAREPVRAPDPRRTPTREPKAEPKRVAVASNASGARDRADNLYRGRKFGEAANVLLAAAKSADAGDARELKDRANKLKALQAAYSKGTAPGEKATAAYASLQQAINLDASVGGNFKSELGDKLRAVAPKAAVAFVAAKNWSSARSAYLAAQAAGSTDSNLPLVKQKLEGYANELYAEAQQESSSNPSSAKDKLKQIRQLVDAASPIATKAQTLYNKL